MFPLKSNLSPLGRTVAVSFDPSQIAGLVLWLQADSLALTTGSAVATWTDSSGSGHDATQSDPTHQPTYQAPVLNGRPVVRFGASSILATSALSVGAFTAFVVFRTTTAGIVYEQSTDLNGGNGFTLYTSTNSTIGRTRGGAYSAKDMPSATWGEDGAWRICAHRFDGTHVSHQLWINGVNQTLSSVITSDPGTAAYSDTLYLGARAGPAFGFAGDLAAVLLYDHALADGDRARVESFLDGRYGIY